MKRSPLRQVRPADHSDEPGYKAWHEHRFGRCQVCGVPGLLIRHHVVLEQHCRALGADPWDLENSLLLGAGYSSACQCHQDHHAACARISVKRVPDAAVRFVAELYGPGAGAYLSRYYSP